MNVLFWDFQQWCFRVLQMWFCLFVSVFGVLEGRRLPAGLVLLLRQSLPTEKERDVSEHGISHSFLPNTAEVFSTGQKSTSASLFTVSSANLLSSAERHILAWKSVQHQYSDKQMTLTMSTSISHQMRIKIIIYPDSLELEQWHFDKQEYEN